MNFHCQSFSYVHEALLYLIKYPVIWNASLSLTPVNIPALCVCGSTKSEPHTTLPATLFPNS